MPFVPDQPAARTSRFVPDQPVTPRAQETQYDSRGIPDSLPELPGQDAAPAAPAPSSGIMDYLKGVDEAAGAVNAAASKRPGSAPIGTLETVGTLASGIPASLIGSLAGMGTEAARGLGLTDAAGEDVAERVQRAMTYRPRSESGKSKAALLGMLTQPITESGADVALAPLLAGESAALSAAGKAPRVAAPAERAAAAAAAGEKTSAQVARDAGFVLKPSEAGGKVGSIVEGVTGSPKLETAAIIKNSKRADELAAQEIGTEGLKASDLAKARAPHSAVYREVGTMGEVGTDPAYVGEISAIGRKPGNSFANVTNEAVEKLKQQYSVDRFSAKDAVQETRELRFKARKNIRAQDPAQNELGWAQLKISDAIENQLERHAQMVGQTDLVKRFQQARVELAKIHSVQRAMRNGRISPDLLVKQMDAGVPLSGNLRTIATVARDFPNVMRNAAKIKNRSPVNMTDTAIALTTAIATGQPAVAAAIFARPMARAALLSQRYQNRLARPSAAAGEAVSPAVQELRNAGHFLSGVLDENQ